MTQNWTQTRPATFDRKNAIHMDDIAKTVFKPIYPVIAQNALDLTGIISGSCLDLGSGPGMLAMAVARLAPEITVTAFDFSRDAMDIAQKNIRQEKLDLQIKPAFGDVHRMPFEDASFDLIVSRGSMFFWKDLKGAFAEILRILAPGGATYIGGGFGSLALKDQVVRQMAQIDPQWNCYAKKKTGDDGIKRFEQMFAQLNCPMYQIIDNDTGFWIMLSKPE